MPEQEKNTSQNINQEKTAQDAPKHMGVAGQNVFFAPPQIVTASAVPQGADAPNVALKDPFFAPPPAVPTQEGPLGIKFDFNDGCRVLLPKGQWHVQIEDAESGNIIFICDVDEGWVVSTKKYYIPFVIKVWKRGEPNPVFMHELNLTGKEVVLKFPVGTVGDTVGWLPYAEKFYLKHKCATELTMGKDMVDIFAAQYPNIQFSAMPGKVRYEKPYATYKMGLFFRGDKNNQPIDFRQVGLHRTAGYILGVDPTEEPPKVNLSYERKIKEPYVVIATKASSLPKMWNNGHGWDIVCKYLKFLGYRVLAIDREYIFGQNFTYQQVPRDAEDFTGNKPLAERIELLQHADFFVGLSSGLSWLAWASKIPVVMISGFTLPICEWNNPYRVFNSHGCNGCWDDVNENFDHKDFFWCPKHKGTDRQFECTRLITGKQVVGHIDRLMKDKNIAAPKDRK
ncbi:autotransporter strand-loop-strand O-heptosyltransferase [Endomicrobium proavitum]|uniref:Glycosyltransferase TibC n=1 Tax=Endomicrobium proavitum TaxID=1408281 RepID=A0A0G3WGP3_9BACT|nr:autotransporter strand-loop-strand O-heptosyltransferase [Endomicrobium proavitum]AKL97488.1 Glycosyltransferase TibC [Endomicrobium proavitum]